MDKESDSEDDGQNSFDKCNVFVKYLPPEVTDTGMYAMFSPFGEILSCKVMVDTQTGNSLGYGFCRFANASDAQQCIARMSGSKYRNKTLLCRLSSQNTATEPSDNLYVKCLLPTTTEESLRDFFGTVGPIKDCKIIIDKKTGESKQIGFVRFENIEDAIKAVETFHGMTIDESQDTPLVVRFAESNQQKIARRAKTVANQSAAAVRNAEAYYSQLAQQAENEFSSMYGYRSPAIPYVLTDTFGNVTYAPVIPCQQQYGVPTPPTQPVSPYSSPAGSPNPYSNVIPAYNYIDSNMCGIADQNQGVSNNLFVFHLPASVTNQVLYQLFIPFGTLKSVKVMRHSKTGASRGYGFVQYFSRNSAYQALSHMNGVQIENKFLKVTFKTYQEEKDQLQHDLHGEELYTSHQP